MKLSGSGSLAAIGMACGLLVAAPAQADLYNGIDFPQGPISIADSVAGYVVGSGGVSAANQVATNALGIPDYDSGADTGYVSLGAGGTLTLHFTDNYLTGSDSAADDLWIFEIGQAVEATSVELSKNGTTWFSVGNVGGATSGVDLDSFGYGSADQFSYVRLTDLGQTSGYSAGADIDAVGAISTVRQTPPTGAPEPATLALFGAGMAGLGFLRKKRKA
jgi:hypothetical protein